jgi:glutamate dehydrogenase
MVVKTLTLQTTDLALDRFPDYTDPIESLGVFQPGNEVMAAADLAPAEAPSLAHKLLSKVKNEEPSRHPSPQPTHLSVPLNINGHNGVNGHNGHKVLRSATVGYIAPEFKGRAEQMKAGEFG